MSASREHLLEASRNSRYGRVQLLAKSSRRSWRASPVIPGECAPRGVGRPCGGERTPPPSLSQQDGEAEGSRFLEAQEGAGAALTTTGRAGTTRRRGPGKQDGKV